MGASNVLKRVDYSILQPKTAPFNAAGACLVWTVVPMARALFGGIEFLNRFFRSPPVSPATPARQSGLVHHDL